MYTGHLSKDLLELQSVRSVFLEKEKKHRFFISEKNIKVGFATDSCHFLAKLLPYEPIFICVLVRCLLFRLF